MEKTTKYSQFKLRGDNRRNLDYKHIDKLAESISKQNLLEAHPILVNNKMEVINGQHRLKAAEKLGVPIYYIVVDNIEPEDMLALNTTKQWNYRDYLNFFSRNGYEDYIRLEEFILKEGLNISTARVITSFGYGSHLNDKEFKSGAYKFNNPNLEKELRIVKRTIEVLRSIFGFSQYLITSKFWLALLQIIRHPDFEEDIWYSKVQRHCSAFGVRSNKYEYFIMLLHVMNRGKRNPIPITDFDDVKTWNSQLKKWSHDPS